MYFKTIQQSQHRSLIKRKIRLPSQLNRDSSNINTLPLISEPDEPKSVQRPIKIDYWMLSEIPKKKLQPMKTISGCLTRNIFRTLRPKSQNCYYSAQSRKNKRPYNQDRVVCVPNLQKPIADCFDKAPKCSYFGVFDGHGGSSCAQFLKQNLHTYICSTKNYPHDPQSALKKAIEKAENRFSQKASRQGHLDFSGSCALVILVSDQVTIVGNVGDCHCVVIKKGSDELTDVNVDHRPSHKREYMRILASGGKVQKQRGLSANQYRIFPGSLNVSRTIGDIEAKIKKFGGLPNVISSEPDIYSIPTNQIQVLIAGTDGIFDTLTKQQLKQVYTRTKSESPRRFARELSQNIVNLAAETATDNSSVICIIPKENNRQTENDQLE